MANQEPLSLLKSAVQEFNRWRNGVPSHRPDLSGADLFRADLRGANLFGANLFGANLGEAKLDAVDLRQANLLRANLTRAGLRGTDLAGANLRYADMRDADMRGASLFVVYLEGTNLRGADLSEALLTEANLEDAVGLSGADLRGVRWDPEYPPLWPEGFASTKNAWVDEDNLGPSKIPGSARELRPVRANHISGGDLAALVRTIEPLLGVAEELLGSDEVSDEDAALIDHARDGLRHELWENPGEPAPAVLTGYSAKLVDLVGRYLSSTIDVGRTEPNQADEAAWDAVEHATNLGDVNPDAAGEAAADVADDFSNIIAELETPGDEEPTEDTRNRASRVVLEHLGWMTAAAGAGASGGVGLVPVIAQSVSPRWGAVLGAIGGVLAFLFKVIFADG